MEAIRTRLGLGLIVLCSLMLATGCELDSGDDADAEDVGVETSGTPDATLDTAEDCSANDICNPACAADPDCTTCDCDRQNNVCNVSTDYTDSACGCDPDCSTRSTCDDDDGVCDTYCHARDNDCDDDCNWYEDVCEAEANHSSERCDNDPDCTGSDAACSNDGHCDTFCDPTTSASQPLAGCTEIPEYDCKDPDCDEDCDGSCD